MIVFSHKWNQYHLCLLMYEETDPFLQTPLALSHCCLRDKDLKYGPPRLCCHFKALHWWACVHRSNSWWGSAGSEEGFPHLNITLSLPKMYNSWLSWSNWLRCLQCMCKCVSVHFLGGWVDWQHVTFWGSHSLLLLSSPLCLQFIASSFGPQGPAGPDGSWLGWHLPPYGSSQGGKSPWSPQMPVYLQANDIKVSDIIRVPGCLFSSNAMPHIYFWTAQGGMLQF